MSRGRPDRAVEERPTCGGFQPQEALPAAGVLRCGSRANIKKGFLLQSSQPKECRLLLGIRPGLRSSSKDLLATPGLRYQTGYHGAGCSNGMYSMLCYCCAAAAISTPPPRQKQPSKGFAPPACFFVQVLRSRKERSTCTKLAGGANPSAASGEAKARRVEIPGLLNQYLKCLTPVYGLKKFGCYFVPPPLRGGLERKQRRRPGGAGGGQRGGGSKTKKTLLR